MMGLRASCTISMQILSRENLWSKEKKVQQELLDTLRASLPKAREPRLERKVQFKLSPKSIWAECLAITFSILLDTVDVIGITVTIDFLITLS